MNLPRLFADGHGREQAVGQPGHQMQFEQLIDEPRTAVAVGAALDNVINKLRAITEALLATLQPLAQTTQLYFHQLAQHRAADGEIWHHTHTGQ